MADIRTLLTDKTIAQLPAADDGWYLARVGDADSGLALRNIKSDVEVHSSPCLSYG